MSTSRQEVSKKKRYRTEEIEKRKREGGRGTHSPQVEASIVGRGSVHWSYPWKKGPIGRKSTEKPS